MTRTQITNLQSPISKSPISNPPIIPIQRSRTNHQPTMSEELDIEQKKVITATATRAILLEAGPGSGKTRTLIGRISYLLKSGRAEVSQIVAVTFTNKAAQELQERVERLLEEEAQELLVGTFHSLAHQILRKHADVVDLNPRFTICDEPLQLEILRHALQRSGMSPHADVAAMRALRNAFSMCKRERHDPADCAGNHPIGADVGALRELLPTIATHYRELLRQHNMLDFDDLILYASRVLYDEPSVGEAWREAHPWLFIDEFHDINKAQYQFVQLLANPGSTQIMAVIDEQQSIYRWRGAEKALLEQFRRDYHPKLQQLPNNYRSDGWIVYACDLLLSSAGIKRSSKRFRQGDGWIERWWSLDEWRESDDLIAEIERLQREEGYGREDIAILYRTHSIGEQLEQKFAQRGIPLDRIQRQPFFGRHQVQELRRYLQAAASVADEFMAAALNFPRMVADELTMIQLRRVAAGRGLTLIELMQTVEACEDIGAATRRQVYEFLRLVQEELVPLVDKPLPQISKRLFEVLHRRRSPYKQEDLETLYGVLDFLEMSDMVTPLHEALQRSQPIQLLADDSLDGRCAATLLSYVLAEYFNRAIPIESLDTAPQPEALQIVCGSTGSEGTREREGKDTRVVLTLTAQESNTIRYPATLMAWRLASALLVACETAPQSEVVIFDLETTGLNPRYHTAVELAAQRLRGLVRADEGYDQLVQPGRSIPRSAVDVHGIFPQDLRDAPHVNDALPSYLDYLGDAILLGHNVGFDVRFLRTMVDKAQLAPLQNPVVDTLALARRLFPDASSHSLEALVEELKLPEGIFHRAMPDVQHTVNLFLRLWDKHRLDQQLHLLSDCLPLVGAVLAAEENNHDENGLLIEAASRLLQRHQPQTLPQWHNYLPAEALSTIKQQLEQLRNRSLPPTADDSQWQAIQNEWERHIKRFMRLSGSNSLGAFLSYTALIHNEPDITTDEERLQLMTIHAAKGKEFKVVFLVGLEEGTMPSYYARSREEQQEERRVCYVGMSRARERLYLLGCAKRGGRDRNHSPFWHALNSIFEG